MRRGFLAAQPTETVYVLTGRYAGHIGSATFKKNSDKAEVQLSNDAVLTLPTSSVCRVKPRVQGERVLTCSVALKEVRLIAILSEWAPMQHQSGEDEPVTDELIPVPVLHLQPELIDHVLSFLEVARVDMALVRAVGCSSIDEDNPSRCAMDMALDPSPDNWWISAPGTTEGGVGAEWLAFCLSENGQPRVVERVELKIPPLPHGPLSVRTFHLESSACSDGPWQRASKDYETLDASASQAFQCEPPVEAPFIRIVCTRNAARAAADEQRASMARRGLIDLEAESEEDRQRALHHISGSIGFFSIAFS